MYKLVILLFVFCYSLSLSAENVTNIRVRQDNQDIVITYDLNKKAVVQLLMASGNSDQYTPLKAISGDVGKSVSAGEGRKIVWHPLEEYEEFVADNVRFKVDAQSSYAYYATHAKVKTLVTGQVGYSLAPELSYGAMIGQMYKGVGWYVSGRSNFQFWVKSELACEKGGFVGEDQLFFNGEKMSSYFVANGGLLINCLEWSKAIKNKFNTLGLYLGAGYGKRDLFWQTLDGEWVKYNPNSYSGVSVDVGVLGSIYGVTLSAGMSTVAFRNMEITIGLGYMF